MTTAGHTPETWYWEAGSEHCPHGPEPDRNSDAWDNWAERHTGSPQDVYICLDAPIGEVCGTCSEEYGDAISMHACRARNHTSPKPGTTPRTEAHEPVPVFVGTYECLDRECDEYFTDDGDEKTNMERCSHITTEVICGGCSKADGHGYYYEPTVPWSGTHTAAPAA